MHPRERRIVTGGRCIVVGVPRRRRTSLASALLTAAAGAMTAGGASPAAWAQASSLSLTWQAPEECPDETFVRAEIDRLLAEGPPPTAQIEAHAVVSRTSEGRWRVHIATVRDGVAGERSIEAASCRPLAEATALIVVLAIDPARANAAPVRPPGESAAAPDGSPGPNPSPVATPPSPPRSAETTVPLPAAVSRTSAPLLGRSGPAVHAGVFAAVGGDIGTLPAPAVGAALTAFAIVGPLRLEAYGAYWFGRSTHGQTLIGQTLASYGGTISLATAGATGCMVLGRGRFDVAPCAGVELGDLHGVGAPSIDTPGTSDGWWVAVVGALHGTMRLFGPLRLGLRVEGAVPLVRDRFVADVNGQSPAVFRTPVVVGRAFLGPELRF